MDDDSGQRDRQKWQQKWTRLQGDDVVWRLEGPPQQLTELLDSGDVTTGKALDIGCGDGWLTGYLAGRFDYAIGLDVAEPAIRSAQADKKEERMAFVVADAVQTPFASSSFDLIFDRGCMQNLPSDVWGAYLGEVARLLRPGGSLQLFCSRPERRPASGVKARLRGLRRGGGRRRRDQRFASYSHTFIERQLPSSLETVARDEIPFRTRSGQRRSWIYGVYKRQAAGQA